MLFTDIVHDLLHYYYSSTDVISVYTVSSLAVVEATFLCVVSEERMWSHDHHVIMRWLTSCILRYSWLPWPQSSCSCILSINSLTLTISSSNSATWSHDHHMTTYIRSCDTLFCMAVGLSFSGTCENIWLAN